MDPFGPNHASNVAAVAAEISPLAASLSYTEDAIGFDGESWVIRIRAQPGFARLAREALELSARARDSSHPTAGIFFRVAGAFREAEQRGAPLGPEQELGRIADALERIADTMAQPIQLGPGHITHRVDDRAIANTVIRYTLQQASRPPSSLSGASRRDGTIEQHLA